MTSLQGGTFDPARLESKELPLVSQNGQWLIARQTFLSAGSTQASLTQPAWIPMAQGAGRADRLLVLGLCWEHTREKSGPSGEAELLVPGVVFWFLENKGP